MGTVTQYNLANVRDALGGGNPVYMSNYYRGGPYVPANRTVATTVYEPAGGGWAIAFGSGADYYWNSQPEQSGKVGSVPAQTVLIWNGTQVHYSNTFNTFSSITISGITYYKGPTWSGYVFYIRRTYPSSYQQAINTGVPSSGAISISQLYGAANP